MFWGSPWVQGSSYIHLSFPSLVWWYIVLLISMLILMSYFTLVLNVLILCYACWIIMCFYFMACCMVCFEFLSKDWNVVIISWMLSFHVFVCYLTAHVLCRAIIRAATLLLRSFNNHVVTYIIADSFLVGHVLLWKCSSTKKFGFECRECCRASGPAILRVQCRGGDGGDCRKLRVGWHDFQESMEKLWEDAMLVASCPCGEETWRNWQCLRESKNSDSVTLAGLQ